MSTRLKQIYDTQSLIVSTTSVSVNEGSTSTFTVRLAAQPTSDVTVNVTRTSGDTDLSVSGGGTLTFTTANWNTPQTVTLSAAEDADTVNGTAVFAVASSGLTSIDVNATEADNDTQSMIVSPLSECERRRQREYLYSSLWLSPRAM